MDPKNDFELDISMESKSHYKLRSSLKKRKSRNPLGVLDITEVNADSTLAPPQRRVSFASSNYVKPFIDDPEKNTIWDNTYEEEVNHTDSTKSENTNHPHLSDLGSHCQDITNMDIKKCITNIYCDPSVVDMDVSYFDQTLINDKIRDLSSESDLDITAPTAANMDLKNITELSKETTFNMELTCQWKTNITQSSIMLTNNLTTNRNYLLGNATISQEEDMSMTCCFVNNGGGKLGNEMETAVSTNVENKENTATVYDKKDKVFFPDQSEMDFTCAFPNNILETKQHKETRNKSPAMIVVSPDVENKENIATVYAKKDKVFFPDQSEMEFTCAFPNNILETNQHKETRNKSPAMTVVSADVENKENIVTVYAKKDKVFFPDQSEMEFTCAFPNNILETNQHKETRNILPAMKVVRPDVDNKENIATVYAKKDKVFFPDQSEMEFTCAFPNNILETNQHKETRNKSPAMTIISADVENKENIVTVYAKKDKVFFPDQSEMEFTCAFPNNILETNQHKETRNILPAMTVVRPDVENKENIVTVYAKKDKVFFPDQSEMEFTCAFPNNILETNQHKEIRNIPPAMKVVGPDVDNKENIAAVSAKKDKVFFPDQSEMEFTCAFPNNILETNQHKKTRNILPAMKVVSPDVDNKENLATVYATKDKVFFPDQSQMEFTCTFPNNILETNQHKGTINKSPTMTAVSPNVENVATVWANKDEVFLPDPSELQFTCAFPNKLETNQLEEKMNSSPTLTAVNPNPEAIENIATAYAKKDPGEMQFHSSNNILGTSQLKGAKAVIFDVQSKENIPMVYTHKENVAVALPIFSDGKENRATDSIFKFKQTEDVNFIKPKVNTEVLKPVKVREFGNIPVAVDISDLSMDQNVNEHYKPVSDTSRRPYDSKENTLQKDPINQSNKINLQDNHMHSNESRENVIHKSIRATDLINKKQNEITSKVICNVKPDLETPMQNEQKPNNELHLSEGFNEKQEKCNILSESVNSSNKCILEEITSNPQITKTTIDDRQNQIGNSAKEEKVEYICAEECTLIESMEGSILINSISIPDEERHTSLDVHLCENIAENEASRGQLGEKIPATKVIYSEPMKVKHFHDDFPSMQTSGLNPFGFTSIASVEDTQQLIQTTFSKPSFAKTDQWEGPESIMVENNESNASNKSDSVMCPHDESRRYQSVLKNIHKKLFLGEFSPFNYKEIADSIQANRELTKNMEKLLLNFKFPVIGTFTLQEETKKLSLCNSSGDSSESMLNVLESVDDSNCNKSMLLEPISLHEKIVDVCARSNNVLKIKYFKGNSYVFSTMYKCVLIYVHVHPEDDRVTEIKPASSLDDCMDSLNHFLVKYILDKLKHSTLKSCLGPYYDILSLLDHICLMVDEVMDFHFEFLSLQKLYPSLKFNPDYSVSYEILHISPPIWWRIRLNMTSVNKINNPENLHCESEWSNIREEHIKEILRNIDEGVGSLRIFISEVSKYFDRTQLRFKV